MDKKRYMEILTDEMSKCKGASGSVVNDIEWNTCLRFAHEYLQYNTGNSKLLLQLFIGKVSDTIGVCKAVELLNEAKEAFKPKP